MAALSRSGPPDLGGRRDGPPAGGSGRGPGSQGSPSPGALPIDYLAAAYLTVTGLLAGASGTGRGVVLSVLHATALLGVAWLTRRPQPRHPVGVFLRRAYPVVLTPLLYQELSVLNQLHLGGYFDPSVQAWEEALFGLQPSVEAARRFGHLWLSELLHLGYLSYYLVVPAALFAAWAAGGHEGLGRTAFSIALAFFLCYLCFAVFPVAGPRYEFARIEGPPARGAVFSLVHAVLEGGSSKGTAFPSSHVAATVAAWLAAGRFSRRVLGWLAAPAVALTLGTVYGRFHYALDAVVGLLVGIVAVASEPWLRARLEQAVAGQPRGGRGPSKGCP